MHGEQKPTIIYCICSTAAHPILQGTVRQQGTQLLTCNLRCQRRQWHPTPVLLPGKSCGQRSLVCCSPWGREESNTTERLHFHFSLSCIGAENGNPLQYSCLENPRDGGAWWAAVYGVAQSRTRLKRLSSSSSSNLRCKFETRATGWRVNAARTKGQEVKDESGFQILQLEALLLSFQYRAEASLRVWPST